jgi:hypothetical protein
VSSGNHQKGERTRVKIDNILVDRNGELTLGRGAILFDRPNDPQIRERSR